MAHSGDIALMAHLMRRAGFGAGRDELEARVAKGYDATVEELLHPETQPPVDHYTLLRHQPSVLLPGGVPPMGNINYMYYLVTTQRPLSYMGQDLLNPPSVEGWHTGQEWINSGSLMARINFVAEQVGNTSLPGVQAIIKRLQAMGVLEPEELVGQAKEWGQIRWDTAANAQAATKHTGELLQLIVATREYQFA